MKKILCVFLAVVLAVVSGCMMTASADSESSVRQQIAELEAKSKKLEAQISNLKSKQSGQQAIVNAIQAKIANTESQIIVCNKEISRLNGEVAAIEAEIRQKNDEIAADQLTFKKRLRATYMSNTDSSVQILLGAKNFCEYLELSQLMKSVSAHDRALMEKLAAAIALLRQKEEEVKKLLAEQDSIKAVLKEKQAALQADIAEANSILKSITNEKNAVTAENKEVEAEKRAREEYLVSITASTNIVLSAEYFIWPVPGKMGVSQQYKGPGIHTGVDLSSGGIAGAPVVAIADGYVKAAVGWSPSMGTRGMASYGNYVVIDHGTRNGNGYVSLSAHLARLAVSAGQTVKQGQVIGYVGTTGNSTGYHLHLELTRNSILVNPLPYIRQQKKP